MRRAAPVLLAALALAALPPSLAAEPALSPEAATTAAEPGVLQPGTLTQLSDGSTFATWATPVMGAMLRSQPRAASPPVAALRSTTEDGRPEVYMLMRQWIDAHGVRWVQALMPVRPRAVSGWVQAAALGPQQVVYTRLLIDRRRQLAVLYRSGTAIWRSRVGVGKRGTPTPAGTFWIRERLKPRDPRGAYGPWAFGTSAYSRLSEWPRGGVVGIHGTDDPSSIPGRPSHGCIRVPNPAIRGLAALMPVGTPVVIR